MLSRDEIRQAERLAAGASSTRDEIGFRLVHQGLRRSLFSRHLRPAYACPNLKRAISDTDNRKSRIVI